MQQRLTLQGMFDAAVLEALLEEVCTAVANQGVEIHQWLRDEKARRGAVLAVARQREGQG